MYKFQTSRGPDRDAEGIKGEGNGEGVSPEWGRSVPLPSRLGGLAKRHKLPQWVRGRK